MASLGHIAVGMAAGRFYADRTGAGAASPMLLFAALSFAPDVDVAAFRLGVSYDAAWGHRGATHALLPGTVVGASLAGAWARFRAQRGGRAGAAR